MDVVVTLTRRKMHCSQPLLRGGRRTVIADIALKTEAPVVSASIGLIYSGLQLSLLWTVNLCSVRNAFLFLFLLPGRESEMLQWD